MCWVLGRAAVLPTLHVSELSEGTSGHPANWDSMGDKCCGLALLMAGTQRGGAVPNPVREDSWHRQLKRRVYAEHMDGEGEEGMRAAAVGCCLAVCRGNLGDSP